MAYNSRGRRVHHSGEHGSKGRHSSHSRELGILVLNQEAERTGINKRLSGSELYLPKPSPTAQPTRDQEFKCQRLFGLILI